MLNKALSWDIILYSWAVANNPWKYSKCEFSLSLAFPFLTPSLPWAQYPGAHAEGSWLLGKHGLFLALRTPWILSSAKLQLPNGFLTDEFLTRGDLSDYGVLVLFKVHWVDLCCFPNASQGLSGLSVTSTSFSRPLSQKFRPSLSSLWVSQAPRKDKKEKAESVGREEVQETRILGIL